MAIMRKKKQHIRGNIIFLPTGDIKPSPVQPRKHFSRDGLEELAASISEHGVLQPLTVRMRNGNYELIAGERRLRASKMLGLEEVPCIMLSVNMEESSIIALVENLQRKDLDVIEEAEGIAHLIRMYGMSQEEAARRLGKSQSSVANKLRLLKLPEDVLERVRTAELSERHARALLRLRKPDEQRYALKHIIQNTLTVAATESFVEYLLSAPALTLTPEAMTEPELAAMNRACDDADDNNTASRHTEYSGDEKLCSIPETETSGKKIFIIKDIKIFLNSLSRSLELMKQGGINVGLDKVETNTDLTLTISIPKNVQGQEDM